MHLTADVKFFYTFLEVGDGWMGGVIGTEDLYGFLNKIGFVNVFDCDDRKWFVITRVAESDPRSRLDRKLVNICLGYIQSDGNGEECAVGKA